MDYIPVDILGLILEQFRLDDFAALCELRLVSKGFSSLVEPLAFSAVTIIPYSFYRDESKRSGQFEALASGNTPNSRWTKKLTISRWALRSMSSLDDGSSMQLNAEQRQINHMARETQKRYLVPAIEALQYVTRVCYSPQRAEPYDEVLEAISRLPNLDHITLSFVTDFEFTSLDLGSFTNLRVVELSYPGKSPSWITTSARELLRNSSASLTYLAVTPWRDMPSYSRRESDPVMMDFGILLEFAPQFPKLEALTINASKISLSPTHLHYLPSLVHLDLGNCSAGSIQDSFWKALADMGARLEFLRIWPLRNVVMDYLTSYFGLRTLCVSHSEDDAAREPEATTKEIDRLFRVVLPHHRHTLKALHFAGFGRRGYAITEEKLKSITGCTGLESLGMRYHFTSGRLHSSAVTDKSRETSVSLEVLLTSLTSTLLELVTLRIQPERHIPVVMCGMGRRGWSPFKEMITKFNGALCDVRMKALAPRFIIQVETGDSETHTLAFSHDRGSFKLVK